MYPKLTQAWLEHRRRYGDTSILATPTFFYGMRPHEPVAVDIDPGKTLVVAYQTALQHQDGEDLRLQFELNGQSRVVTVEPDRTQDRGKPKASQKRPQADPDDPTHVAAPMPGAIITVAVQVGQKVRAGSPLLSLEAMKMETHLHAERDGTVEKVLVAAGDQVQAKDLLLIVKPGAE